MSAGLIETGMYTTAVTKRGARRRHSGAKVLCGMGIARCVHARSGGSAASWARADRPASVCMSTTVRTHTHTHTPTRRPERRGGRSIGPLGKRTHADTSMGSAQSTHARCRLSRSAAAPPRPCRRARYRPQSSIWGCRWHDERQPGGFRCACDVGQPFQRLAATERAPSAPYERWTLRGMGPRCRHVGEAYIPLAPTPRSPHPRTPSTIACTLTYATGARGPPETICRGGTSAWRRGAFDACSPFTAWLGDNRTYRPLCQLLLELHGSWGSNSKRQPRQKASTQVVMGGPTKGCTAQHEELLVWQVEFHACTM